VIVVHRIAEELARATAAWLRERDVAATSRCAICLSGGSTPRRG
jgi:6-phosphogluconolactonase/glucosamine-6-phosphate isomerase/deaminase